MRVLVKRVWVAAMSVDCNAAPGLWSFLFSAKSDRIFVHGGVAYSSLAQSCDLLILDILLYACSIGPYS